MVVLGVEESGVGAHISIQNRSDHTVYLSNVSIMYHDRAATWREHISHLREFKRIPRRLGWVYSSLSNYEVEDGCPVALAPRDAHHAFIPNSKLEEIFRNTVDRKIIAVVQDKIWNSVYSKAYHHPQAIEQGA